MKKKKLARLLLLTLGILFFLTAAKAAHPAGQPDETLIHQLRKVDRELNDTFKEVVKRLGEKERKELRKEQSVWLRERDKKCGSTFSGKSREDWLLNAASNEKRAQCVLKMSKVRKQRIYEKWGTHSTANVKSQMSVCKTVASLIKKGTIDNYVPDKKFFDPRGIEYLNLDIDCDGIVDNVTYSSGSGESLLEIYLSSGEQYELEESGPMMLLNLNGKIYVLVTYWISETFGVGKIINKKLYILNKINAKLVCSNL